MVIGIATGLLGLGLALPTGLAFGYGYGYGVRQGYSAFKQPSKHIQDLKMSPDPIQGSLGMGLQTAEERTGSKEPIPLSRPTLQSQETALMAPQPAVPTGGTPQSRRQALYVYSKSGKKSMTIMQKKKMGRNAYKNWYNDSKSFNRR